MHLSATVDTYNGVKEIRPVSIGWMRYSTSRVTVSRPGAWLPGKSITGDFLISTELAAIRTEENASSRNLTSWCSGC